ncbi:MAG TPA: SPOR domain-containing protein, partial [Candidatus Binatia bacterium]|nr:SPOR domain-containing protein [Candidatus Binatia bacterium]
KLASGANPSPAQTENSLRQQKVSVIDKAGEPANRDAQVAPAKANLRVASSTPNADLRLAAKSTPAAEGAKTAPILHSAENALSKKWSVQVSAAPAKDIADTLAQRLKASGYDGYVVQAEVKGQSYYRVRVGRFDTKEEAESIRQSLARQEAHQDAYITRD